MDGRVKKENELKQELLVATEACKSAQQQLQAAETKTVQYKKKVQELRRREVDAAEVRPKPHQQGCDDLHPCTTTCLSLLLTVNNVYLL